MLSPFFSIFIVSYFRAFYKSPLFEIHKSMVKKSSLKSAPSLPFFCLYIDQTCWGFWASNNPLQETYYLNIKGSIQCFVVLMSGTFSCYRSSGTRLWRVNDGKDSIIVHICTLGVPAKDGYWVYREALMTHLLDVSILQNVYQIEQINHNSRFIHLYDVVCPLRQDQ